MPRDESIDALRGLAVALVVAGHAILSGGAVFQDGPGLVQAGAVIWVPMATATNPVLSFVYSFHMPFFAFVAGLVLRPLGRPPGEQILRRARGLLVPYWVWFALLYPVALWVQPAWSGGLRDAIVYAAVGQSVLWWVLWYLYALFICLAIVLCIARVPGSRWILAASALAAVAFSPGGLAEVPSTWLYLPSLLWIYPFLVLGYLISSWKPRVLKHRRLIASAGMVAFVPLLYLRHPLYVRPLQPIGPLLAALYGAGFRGAHTLSQWAGILLPYLCASAAILGLYGLYVGRGGKAVRVQAWVGRRSLGVYATHFPVQWLLVSAGVRDAIVLFVVSLGVAAALTALLERVPVLRSVLLGQWDVRPREHAGGSSEGSEVPEGGEDPSVQRACDSPDLD